MGFDLIGKNTNFRNNAWWWRPLWQYVTETCQDILTEKDIESGSYNNGHLINEDKALKIARRLELALKSGAVKKHEESYRAHLETLPKDNFNKNYPFNEENVKEFSEFCRKSGGFKIW